MPTSNERKMLSSNEALKELKYISRRRLVFFHVLCIKMRCVCIIHLNISDGVTLNAASLLQKIQCVSCFFLI